MEQFLADFLLLFLPLPSILVQKALFTAKISFSTTSHRSARAKRQDHAAIAFARYAHMLRIGATCLQRHSPPAFSHTRTTAKTRNAFSLLSALFEQFAHIKSGFTTTPSCPVRANAHYARVRYCARSGAPARFGAAAFALQKCAESSSCKAKKRDRPSPFAKKDAPCRFRRHGVLATRRFVGAKR